MASQSARAAAFFEHVVAAVVFVQLAQVFLARRDLGGKLLYSWGTFGGQPGQLWGVHQISTDSEGNFYVAEVYNGRPQKFTPRKNADPAHLIGQFQ